MWYEFRPLTWTDKETLRRRGAHLFKASWDDTIELLARETEYLDAGHPVVIQVDAPEAQIRRDGMLHARARVNHPGVAISFQSMYGPLRYATDAYEDSYYSRFALTGWQANVRAIALALEALRAVDRYGVTRRGEQYTGWKALEAGNGRLFADAADAESWLRKYAAELGVNPEAPLNSVYRSLARIMHPDHGGPRADWDRLDAARQLFTAAGLL